jgi:hypothetical protein
MRKSRRLPSLILASWNFQGIQFSVVLFNFGHFVFNLPAVVFQIVDSLDAIAESITTITEPSPKGARLGGLLFHFHRVMMD